MDVVDLVFISTVEPQEASNESRPGRAEAYISGSTPASCSLGSSGPSHAVLLSSWRLKPDDTALSRKDRGLLEILLCTVLT